MEQTPLSPADLSIDSHLSADRLVLPGGAPIQLPTGPVCWQVATGKIEVYLVWPNGRQLLSVADTGALIFSLGPDAPPNCTLSLVTAEPATLTRAEPDKHTQIMPRQADFWIKSATAALTSHLPDNHRTLDEGKTDNVDDADADPTNEYNTSAVLTGTDLDIVDGGGTLTVDLSSLVDDADADPTNEHNTSVALTGTTLDVTDGGGTISTDLSSLVDDADSAGSKSLKF